MRGGRPMYRHDVINHSTNFMHPADQTIHTQNIERLWRSAKRRNKLQSGTARHHLKAYINEFIFRRHVQIRNLDLFDELLDGIAGYMPPF